MKKEQRNNRPKSKNNPYGKKRDANIDWSEYVERRRAEKTNQKEWLSDIADKACELMGLEEGARDRRVSATRVSGKVREPTCYLGLETYFEKHPDELETCRLKRAYKKSWYRLRVSAIDPHILQQIVVWMGKDDAEKTLVVDSTGFSVSRRREWMNAKYGKLDVKTFDKMHILQASHGRICAITATDGDANDSPILRELLPFLPQGSGGDVLAGAAYANTINCEAVVEAGRKPIMMPKANSVAKGFNALADMLRFRKHPGTFYRKLAKRNNVESTFSAIKARFGSSVRATKRPNREIELLSMAICYNMTV